MNETLNPADRVLQGYAIENLQLRLECERLVLELQTLITEKEEAKKGNAS